MGNNTAISAASNAGSNNWREQKVPQHNEWWIVQQIKNAEYNG